MSRPFTIAVEGNIASGKTTFLNYFSKLQNVKTLAEPVDKWRNVRGHNLLGLMYESQSRWSMTFQTYVQLTMLEKHTTKVSQSFKLMERSIHSARFCFVENLYKSGKLSLPDYIVLDEWYQWLNENVDVNVDLYVYLKTSPEVVYQRILSRGRPEEQQIPLKYLEDLHDLHEKWLVPASEHSNVLVLDGNQDMESMIKTYENSKAKIFNSNVSTPLRELNEQQLPTDKPAILTTQGKENIIA